MDKVLVAMSGGVDSGVAAYKLYERYACIAHKNGRYLLKKAAVPYDGDVVLAAALLVRYIRSDETC